MIAALYVDPNGAYSQVDDVELWPEERDARLYAGPWPVVAHPPCARWCNVAHLVESIYGYKVGDDAGTFAAALTAVRTYGGVLEHPAASIAWSRYQLPRPSRHGWSTTLDDPGWATEIDQHVYGHRARKRTWLYYVGRSNPPALNWTRASSASRISSFRHHKGMHESERVRPREASLTPPAFRDVLIEMARRVPLATAV